MSQRQSCVPLHHVIAKAAGRGRCYHGLSITRSVQDNHFCAVNPRFIAVVTECTGGGAFTVIAVCQVGRVSPLHARVCGHSARVLDVKWDPFNDLRIASCSEDCTVKVWDIPVGGLKADLKCPSKDLLTHTRRVSLIEWHPTARDLLLSAAYDCRVCVWRLDSSDVPVFVIDTHSELVLSMGFNADGSLLATACKDKKIRILDPRTGRTLQECVSGAHRVSRVLFLWDLKMLLSTGVSCWNQRQFVLWALEDLSEPLLEEDLDAGSGVIFPFYDADTHMLYLAGKGDGNIRCYAVAAVKPYAQLLTEHRSPAPHRGLGVMPKRGLNVSTCEVFRFYRLLAAEDLLEPLSFCVPRRRSAGFHEDVYPMTAANEAALSAHEWLMGRNKGPLLMSLRPKAEPRHTDSETAANQSADQPPDIITDLRDWTEDDTHSQDWSALGPEVRGQVEVTGHLEVRGLLEQRDARIRELELELKELRRHMRASF